MRIDVSEVTFRYEKEPILRGVSAEFPSGSLTVLCGRTGSGKSTLLQVLAGLEKPESGTVRHAEPMFRERIGMVFQLPETQLFAGTVRQDVEYGLELRKMPKSERAERVEEALRMVGLEPEAFGERSPFLVSGGEKRRVVIAGALATEPQVLLLDEPTAGLDPAAARELVEILKRLRNEGMTVVVSTHDLEVFFPLADQVLVMREGQVAYAGGTQALLAEPGILEEAGLELPMAARIAHRLRKRGMQVEVAVDAQQLKAEVLRGMRGESGSKEKAKASDERTEHAGRTEQTGRQEHAERLERPEKAKLSDGTPMQTLLQRLDPRAKWFGMLVLSLGFLSISNLSGAFWSVLIVFGLVNLAKIPQRRLRLYLRPFLFLFAFLWAISALTFENGIGISYEGAVQGGLGVLRFLLVIVVGLIFTETTTGAPLREGFEWLIKPLRHLRVSTRDLSLGVSIAVQFVPWILDKIAQLRKAFASRGQDAVGLRKWTPRQLALLFVPLLILVIKMGDELATAIESRGYDRQAERTSWHQLNWQRRDTGTALLTATAAILIGWLG